MSIGRQPSLFTQSPSTQDVDQATNLLPKQLAWRFAQQNRCPVHKCFRPLGHCCFCAPKELKPLPETFVVKLPKEKKQKKARKPNIRRKHGVFR